MKVECPSCQTTFNLPDDKVGPEGANVRCSVCKHVFHVDAPLPEDFPGFGDSGGLPGWPVEEEASEQPTEDFAGRMEEERKKDRFDDATVSSREFTSIDFGGPEKKKEGGLSSKSLFLAAVLALVVMVGIAGTAAYFFEFWPFAKKPATSAMEDAKLPAAPAPEQPDALRQIQIVSHEYYFVDNEKLGKLFVISGKLVNKSEFLVRDIEMEASVMDAQDKPLDTKTFKAGPKASNFELKTLGKEDLESRLTSKQEIMLYNGEVKPGDEVPFMVAFMNPPEALKNYSLRIKAFAKVVPSDQKNPEKK